MKLLVSLGLLILLIAISLFFYSWYRLHIKLNLHAENSKIKLPIGWKAETQFVTNSDTQKIAYWYFPVPSPKAVILLIHGYDNPGGKPQMLGHAQYLHENGYSTVLIDLRGYGESDGNKMTLAVNEWKDVEAVYDHTKSLPENVDKKIGFFGVSMGAATALITAGQTGKGDFVIASVPWMNFFSLFYAQIKAVSLPPTILYPFMILAAPLELGKNYQQFMPYSAIEKIQVPVFLISAAHDEELDSRDPKALYDLANSPKEYWVADSRHDIFHEHPEEFKQKILSFLQKYTQQK